MRLRQKELHVTVDYPDDVERAGRLYSRQNIDQMMAHCARLGLRRVYWIYYHPSMLQAALSDGDADDILPCAVEAAHRHGLEAYALYKPFETGLYLFLPRAIRLPADVHGLESGNGFHPIVDAFVAEHPEFRLRRKPAPGPVPAVAAVKLVKRDAGPTRIRRDDLEIWVGRTNGAYHPYTGPAAFSDGVEQRDGAPVGVLTLSGLEIPRDCPYVLVCCTRRDDTPDFVHTGRRMMEVYDRGGHRIPAVPDEGPLSLRPEPGLFMSMERALKVVSLWRYGEPDRLAGLIPPDYGGDPSCTAYCFDVDCRLSARLRALDGNGCLSAQDGLIGAAVARNEYLCGALHPAYSEVRAYWMENLRTCLDAGVDGVDIRICNHSSWTMNGEEYGFNEPAVDEYRKRYGVNVLEEPFDRDRWKALQGEYFTRFLAEARQELKARNRKMQIHLSVAILDDPFSGLNNLPRNFQWDWQRWIRDDLADSVLLKYGFHRWNVAAELASFAHRHGKKVYNDCRLDYAGLTPDKDEEILGRLRWGLVRDDVDGTVLYEGACFMDLDPASGTVRPNPRIADLLTRARYSNPTVPRF